MREVFLYAIRQGLPPKLAIAIKSSQGIVGFYLEI